jgi:hypothetical protein
MRFQTLPAALGIASAALMAGVASGGPPPIRHVTLATTSNGILFYRGNRLPGPYVIDVTYRLTPDTLWLAAYVNRLPLTESTESAPPSRATPDTSLFARRGAFVSHLGRLVYRERRMGIKWQSDSSRVQDEVRAASELVDSVVSRPDGTLSFYWRGSNRPLDLLPPQNLGPRPPAGSDVHQHALTIALGLERGRLIFVGHGWSELWASGNSIREYLDDVEAIKRGVPWGKTHIQDPWTAEDLIRPLDLSTVRRGDY